MNFSSDTVLWEVALNCACAACQGCTGKAHLSWVLQETVQPFGTFLLYFGITEKEKKHIAKYRRTIFHWCCTLAFVSESHCTTQPPMLCQISQQRQGQWATVTVTSVNSPYNTVHCRLAFKLIPPHKLTSPSILFCSYLSEIVERTFAEWYQTLVCNASTYFHCLVHRVAADGSGSCAPSATRRTL